MTIPIGIIDDLKRDEGFRSRSYRDHLEHLTIGYGFLIEEHRSVDLPKGIAEQWLEHLVSRRWSQLLVALPWIEEQSADVKRALLNMAYQLGVNGLLSFEKMLAALAAGDRNTAADEALDSDWAKQTPERAHRVAFMIRGT